MTLVTRPCPTVSRSRSSTIGLLALLTLTTGLAAQEGGEATSPEAQPAADVAAEDWASRRREAEQRLLRAQQQLDGLVAQNPSAQPPQWITEEIELLQYLELVYAQHESTQKLHLELQQDAVNEQQRLDLLRDVGPAEERPYSFLLLDQLRDQHAGEISRQEGLRAEIDGYKQMVASLRSNYGQSESKRRALREQLAGENDPQSRLARERDLKLAQLYSEVLDAAIGYRASELENAKIAVANAEQHAQYLQEKIAIVEKEARFSQADLDAIFAELSEDEEEVRKSIDDTRVNLQRAEQQWLGARHEAENQPADQATADEKVQARQMERETTQTILTILNERMADVILCRHVWNLRFRLANESFAAEQYREWFDEASTLGKRLEQGVNRSNLRVREAMETLATLEKRLLLAQRDNPEQARWIQAQIDARQKEINASGISLVRIDRVQRLMDQYQAELKAKLGTGENVWGERISAGLQTCWNYELTAIDDRPITVKKIITGLALLLAGYYLSRYLSRLVGRRLLPRIGLDPGVTSALQTIAFYTLLVTFSLFSLQLISIPLTVFAFLGGAVAIGVGFGSQNILNNFISGLILLAERPIRVGDLVEIDGLHGNVENIGARSTRVRTGANLEIIVPNSKFLENNVTNLTLSDTRIRVMVSVGVAYGSPTREVDRLLREAVASRPEIHIEPQPIVLFKDFGDNSLLFEIHFWINARTIMQAQKIESEVRHRIDDLCRQAEITIAFPQRDVHLDTVRPIEVNLRAIADEAENRFGSLQQRRAA